VKFPGLNTQSSMMTADRTRMDRALSDLQSKAKSGAVDGQPTDNDMVGLRKIADQFEALFFNQLLSSMRSTVPENEFWGSGSGGKIYEQLQDEALAERMASRGGLGIADLIVGQFKTNVEAAGAGVPTDMNVMGPPSPDRVRGLAAYRHHGQVGEDIARVVRLQHNAQAMGGAVADSLKNFQQEIVQAAEAADVDPALVLAVVVRESGGDPNALSPKGAQGLMQLMPGTARELGVADAQDPAQNLAGGARYLSRMLRRYDGDVDLALAAYNAGPGTVDRAGKQVPAYPETQKYVKAVKDLAQKLGFHVGTVLDKGSPEE